MTDRTPVLHLEGLVAGHGHRPLVGPIDAAWSRGEIVAVTGANGSGKTTLLRTILGLRPPLAGRVQMAAADRIGYVPQQAELDPVFPVRTDEVVAMGVARGGGRAAIRERVQTALERVGLHGMERASFFELSGGQRQRALIARALVDDPVLLVLDEPAAGIDAEGSARIAHLLGDLARGGGPLVLVVTHERSILPPGDHRVLAIECGRLVPAEAARA